MIKVIFIAFSLLSMGAIYATYTGAGLQEVQSEVKKKKNLRSSHWGSSSSSGWSSGK
jgi:hypothetical protein